MLEMEYSSYSRLERGTTKLTEKRLDQILKVLQVPRSFLEEIEIYLNEFSRDNACLVPKKSMAHYEEALSKTLQLVGEQIEVQNRLIEKFIELMKKNKAMKP